MFHFKFHVSLFKTLWERFKNTEGALSRSHRGLNRSHSVFVFLPQCFLNETLKLKMKHKYTMFHLLNALITNVLKLKK